MLLYHSFLLRFFKLKKACLDTGQAFYHFLNQLVFGLEPKRIEKTKVEPSPNLRPTGIGLNYINQMQTYKK